MAGPRPEASVEFAGPGDRPGELDLDLARPAARRTRYGSLEQAHEAVEQLAQAVDDRQSDGYEKEALHRFHTQILPEDRPGGQRSALNDTSGDVLRGPRAAGATPASRA